VLVAIEFPLLCVFDPEPAPNNQPIFPNILILLLTAAVDGTLSEARTIWFSAVAMGSDSAAGVCVGASGGGDGRSERAFVMARRASCIVSSSVRESDMSENMDGGGTLMEELVAFVECGDLVMSLLDSCMRDGMGGGIAGNYGLWSL
jgi:hypothetical protein